MTTFLLISLLFAAAAKVQHARSPEAVAARIEAGTATQAERQRFVAWANHKAEKAERRLRRIEARRGRRAS